MSVSLEHLKELRERTGAGVMDCKQALLQSQGDMERAIAILREKGLAKALKKAERPTGQGIVEAYIHAGGRLGAIVELNCESDFVARTREFKDLAHDLAMQVAATNPRYIGNEDIPQGEINLEEESLLHQPFIKEPDKTIRDVLVQAVAKLGENIRVRRFARFELGK